MDKQHFQRIFKEILENPLVNEKIIEKYFSRDYIQHVDGKTLNYNDFVRHLNTLKKTIKHLSITIRSIVKENEIIFTNHLISGIAQGGKTIKGEVIAEFRLKNDQIYYCNELTYITGGDEENKNIGSV